MDTKPKYIITSGLVTCEQLKRRVSIGTKSPEAISKEMGIGATWLRDIMAGRYMMSAANLARLCAYFGCGPDELIEFHGYEVDKRYEGYRFEPPENAVGELTFEPLRSLFYDTYTERGEDWKKKLKAFFDSVENTGGRCFSESQVKAFAEVRERKRAEAAERGGKRAPHASIPGVSAVKRAAFSLDRDMKIQSVYDVCRALRCPIGRVLGYR